MAERKIKAMRLRHAGVCPCGAAVPAGTAAGWDATNKTVLCPTCLKDATPANPPTLAAARTQTPWATPAAAAFTAPPAQAPIPRSLAQVLAAKEAASPRLPPAVIDVGTPGASLRQEHERRHDKREAQIRGAHPKLGGLILALSSDPASTTAFAKGAAGEEALAASLEKDCGKQVLFLHNRLLGPGRRDGDVDHLAVAPSGVYVIDAKNYAGAVVEVRTTGGILSERVEKLYVRNRNSTHLLDGLDKPLDAVTAALADWRGPATDISALLCFVDAKLPLLRKQQARGFPIMGLRATRNLLNQAGPLDAGTREALHRHLAGHLPPA